MPFEIGSHLIDAVLGVIFGMGLPAARQQASRIVKDFTMKRRTSLLSSDRVRKWLLDYYRDKESHVDLFHCNIGAIDATIPFLTRPNWQVPERLALDRDTVIQMSRNSEASFPVIRKLLRKRAYLGQRVFGEGNTMYLDRIDDRDGLRVFVRPCPFAQMASRLIELEEETFAAAKAHFRKPTPLRDRCLRDAATAGKVNERPFSAGCTVALALKSSRGYDLLIQTRSTATMTFGGAKAVVPNFGLEPNWSTRGSSKLSLLFFNFVKEYCEELFDYEELTDISVAKRPSPDWFTRLPEAEQLLRMHTSGLFKLDFLGFGIDALNGTGNIALLAVVEDDSFARELENSIKANWEIGSDLNEGVMFVDYADPKLGLWLHEGKLQYGSAFTIDLAMRRLGPIGPPVESR